MLSTDPIKFSERDPVDSGAFGRIGPGGGAVTRRSGEGNVFVPTSSEFRVELTDEDRKRIAGAVDRARDLGIRVKPLCWGCRSVTYRYRYTEAECSDCTTRGAA